ncbi:unnamed protein product, partial [Symbiodinium sp. CCMP2456]
MLRGSWRWCDLPASVPSRSCYGMRRGRGSTRLWSGLSSREKVGTACFITAAMASTRSASFSWPRSMPGSGRIAWSCLTRCFGRLRPWLNVVDKPLVVCAFFACGQDGSHTSWGEPSPPASWHALGTNSERHQFVFSFATAPNRPPAASSVYTDKLTALLAEKPLWLHEVLQKLSREVQSASTGVELPWSCDNLKDAVPLFANQMSLEQGKDNQKALLCAAEGGALEEATALIAAGTDLNAKDGRGVSALCTAAAHGHRQVVWRLVDAGADKDQADDSGNTPLSLAVQHGYCEIVRFLIDVTADVNSSDVNGRSPLTFAAQQGNFAVAKHLVE